jgi:retron-type reverse transcriptase
VRLLEDLYAAYYDARRHKRNTRNQLKFELKLEENLMRLHDELAQRRYKVGRSVAFIIEEPVKREVFAAGFADRVVHHLYFNYVCEIFEREFIYDSYSCRVGKGTSRGIARLDHHVRSCSQNYSRRCWVMKLDLSGYFMSIDRARLYEMVVATLRKYERRRTATGGRFGDVLDYDLLMYLTGEIIFHDPVADCFIKGDPAEWEGLPADKSLLTAAPGCGLPIGNLTSQLFSNVYLNKLDQYVKRVLKVKHYGRYVDDFYMVHESKDFLLDAMRQIKEFLKKEMGLKLHPKKIYLQPVDRGVPFLGAVVKPHRIYMGKRTVANFKRAVGRGRRFFARDPAKLVAMLNSYFGLMRHYKTFELRRRVVCENLWMMCLGWLDVRLRRFSL